MRCIIPSDITIRTIRCGRTTPALHIGIRYPLIRLSEYTIVSRSDCSDDGATNFGYTIGVGTIGGIWRDIVPRSTDEI